MALKTEEHQELTQAQSKLLGKQLVEAFTNKHKADLNAAERLHAAWSARSPLDGDHVPFWRFCGASSWQDYVERRLGISIVTAMHYIRPWEVFGVRLKLGAHPDVREQGILKLYHLSFVVDARNVHQWLQKAKSLTLQELIVATKMTGRSASVAPIHGASKKGGVVKRSAPLKRDDIATRGCSFQLTPKERKSLNYALQLAEQKNGKKRVGELLQFICELYISQHGNGQRRPGKIIDMRSARRGTIRRDHDRLGTMTRERKRVA